MKILVLYGSSRPNGNMKGEGRHSRDEGYSAEYGGGRRACTQDEEPYLDIVYTSLRNRLSAYANVS